MAAKKTSKAHGDVSKASVKRGPRERPVLTVKISGPGVRSGRISVPELLKICQETQNAVTKQAEALEGRKTIHPGPTSTGIRHDCTLELVGVRKGSTRLDFGIAKPQLALPFGEIRTFGAEVVSELANTIQSLGNGNKKGDIGSGVLQSIYGLTDILGKRGLRRSPKLTH